MILCFSGTGNSRRVADQLQELLGDDLQRPAPGYMNNPALFKLSTSDQRVIWVFPTHGWDMPRATRMILDKMQVDAPDGCVHHAVITCGDDIGYADVRWRKAIEARGWKSGSAYTVVMPNSYTFMKGFDVDPEPVAQAKLAAAPSRVSAIAYSLEAGDHQVVDVVRGKMPWIKTYVLGRWFHAFMMSTRPFHTDDKCIGCGRCARNCPVNSISIVDGKPNWDKNCTMCMRCYHFCPQHAVQYGRATRGKGQYTCPGFVLND